MNRKRKILIGAGIGFLVLVFVLISALYYILNYRFEKILQDFVARETKGAYRVQVEKFRFDLTNKVVALFNCRLEAIDTLSNASRYQLTINQAAIRVGSISQIIFQKFVTVEDIICLQPHFELFQTSQSTEKKNLPRIYGDIYEGIRKVLDKLEVHDCRLQDASLTIHTASEKPRIIRINPTQFQLNDLGLQNQEDPESFLYSDNIVLNSGYQSVANEDSSRQFSIAKFHLSTKERVIILDSCVLTGSQKDSVSASYHILIPQLRLINVDFNALYSGKIKIDTVSCQDPDVHLNLHVKEQEEKDKPGIHESIRRVVRNLFGDFDLGMLELQNAHYELITTNAEGENRFEASNNHLRFHNLKIIKDDEENPLQVGGIDFAFHHYRQETADKRYFISFDSITLRDNDLYLKNFRLEPNKDKKMASTRDILVPELRLRNISIGQLILMHKLKAGEIILRDPEIELKDYEKRPATHRSLEGTLNSLKDYLEMDRIVILNGKTEIRTVSGTLMSFEGFDSYIDLARFLNSKDIPTIMDATDQLSVKRGKIQTANSTIELTNATISPANGTWLLDQIKFGNDQTEIMGNKVRIRNLRLNIDDEQGNFLLDSITWSSGQVKLSLKEKNTERQNNKKNLLMIGIIDLNNTQIVVQKEGEGEGGMTLKKLYARSLEKNEQDEWKADDFKIEGESVRFTGGKTNFNLDKIQLNKYQSSYLGAIHVRSYRGADTVRLDVPWIAFSLLFREKLNSPDMHFKELVIPKAEAYLRLTRQAATEQKKQQGSLVIDQLKLDEPNLDIAFGEDQKKLRIKSASSVVELSDFKLDRENQSFQTGNIDLLLKNLELFQNDSPLVEIKKGQLQARFDRVNSSGKSWYAGLNSLEITKADVSVNNKKKQSQINFKDIGLVVKEMKLSDTAVKDLTKLVLNTPVITISNLNSEFRFSNYQLNLNGGKYIKQDHEFRLDSIVLKPLLSKEAFFNKVTSQKDYMMLKTGKIIVHRVNPLDLKNDSVFRAGKVEIFDPFLSIYKDKRLPFDSSVKKPLPVGIFKKMKSPFKVDSLLIHGVNLDYTEFNNKTNKEGHVIVTNGQGILKDIQTTEFGPTDSLSIRLQGYLMDSALIKAHFKESYIDSMETGYFSLRSSPFNLKVLNSFLDPIASARIESGYLDTLYLRAVANEYIAFGESHMVHDNLRVELLKTGDASAEKRRKGLLSFIANLLIKKENHKTVGTVYAERDRSKFVINYWIKIFISGAATSVGIKSNKSMVRKYKKQLEKTKLPPIELNW